MPGAVRVARPTPRPPPAGGRGGEPSGLRFAGYAAVFDVADRGGDVVRRGAFGPVRPVPLLWQHGGAPVGVVEAIGEDAHGLRVIGRIDDAALAASVAQGSVRGLSFGYRAARVRRGAFRELLAVELIEVSLVARPMQPLARVLAVEGAGLSD